mmetsp:Transcript_39450/g.63778  ORF Transcript_39450/g.63778 Transcript_39450/m.63778 type:complete len:95 (-) Transcript_39450:177-461(-)
MPNPATQTRKRQHRSAKMDENRFMNKEYKDVVNNSMMNSEDHKKLPTTVQMHVLFLLISCYSRENSTSGESTRLGCRRCCCCCWYAPVGCSACG